MANADELNATLDVIKADPNLWNQDAYICGTTACFFGHTLLRHGYSLDTVNAGYVERRACQILDLNRNEMRALAYYFTDSVEDLELRVKEIIAGEWRNRAMIITLKEY